MLIGDFHIHSKYSRACSRDLTIPNLEKWARIKGISFLGTGDFQHPKWFPELKENLQESDGVLKTKTGYPFILQTEISLMYSQDGKGRKVHLVILAPGFEVASQIREYLGSLGRLDYDGRPIFGRSCIEVTEALKKISNDIEIIPAHCLLPNAYIHTEFGLKRIDSIEEKEQVLTHAGEFKSVTKIFQRNYAGELYKIIPWYFREGLTTTPEHPFLAVKSAKHCLRTKGICKPLCSQKDLCKQKLYNRYKIEWVPAINLEVGDFLVYPRIKKESDITEIKLSDIVDYKKLHRDAILPKNSRNWKNPIRDVINMDKDFCLLAGYYLAEGYVIKSNAIAFSFNANEKDYVHEVIFLMQKIFGIVRYKIDSRRKSQADIIFFSRILNEFFKRFFYSGNTFRAWSKDIPHWMTLLPKIKIAEILRGWWRGDSGYSVSRELINKMKLICLKLGIIPSISVDTAKSFNERGKHFIGNRKIIAQRDTFIFSNLSFFEENYGMLNEKCFKEFVNVQKRKHGWIDDNNIYMPIRHINITYYEGKIYNLEVSQDNSYLTEFAAVHNCWTPYFGVFGSKSGFDSLKQAFGEQVKHIYAIETGLSSDPLMNQRLSKLDKINLVSNSDSHSFWPWRLGREATLFDCELTYKNIINAIRTGIGLCGTIEVDPAYGIYHWDGHRNCNVRFSPEESKRHDGICPVCEKKLTLGVEYRVDELADRDKTYRARDKPMFYSLLPLHELIAASLGVKQLASTKVWHIYNELISKFNDEFNILINVSEADLIKAVDAKLAGLIIKNRRNEIKVDPGYDGVYGRIITDSAQIAEQHVKAPERPKGQLGLSTFVN